MPLSSLTTSSYAIFILLLLTYLNGLTRPLQLLHYNIENKHVVPELREVRRLIFYKAFHAVLAKVQHMLDQNNGLRDKIVDYNLNRSGNALSVTAELESRLPIRGIFSLFENGTLPSKFTFYLDQLMKIDANSSYNIYVDTRDKIFQPIWSGNISIEQDFEEISQKQERFPVLGLIYARKANHVFQLYLRMEHWLQCKPTYFFPRQLLSCFHHVYNPAIN